MELFDYLKSAGYKPELRDNGIKLVNIATSEVVALLKGLNFRGHYHAIVLDNLEFLIVEA